MSRESRVIISHLIVVVVFISSLLAAALGNFFITLIVISGGLIVWLLYLLAADLGVSQVESGTEAALGKSLSKVVAGLGGVLAVSAFLTYGVRQTLWGGYTFELAGLALALAVVGVTLLPLVVLRLTSKPGVPATPRVETPVGTLSEAAAPPPTAAVPEQPLYYGEPYPAEYAPYGPEEDVEYEEADEDWEEGEEDDYEDEEDYEDEDEEDENEEEEEDVR